MITGTHPYVANTGGDRKLPRPSEICQALPRAAGDILLRAVSYQPEDRPSDVATYAASFEAACQGKRPKRFPLLAVAGAVSLAAFAPCDRALLAWNFLL
jgi:hypothetical protein